MSVIIALDAMGGDFAPESVIQGASLFIQKYSKCTFLIFGNQERIHLLLEKHSELLKCSEIIHVDQAVTNTTKPSLALRHAVSSSMGAAIKAVAEKKAHAVVSSGNTGAFMALSKMILKTLDGVDRPAIAKLMPTIKGKSIMLDLGANTECKKETLIQFALMGEAFAIHANIHDKNTSPRVGLLNIGSESSKGPQVLQDVAEELKNLVNFHGFIEGDDVAKGTTDVIVTDGFSGNIALKTMEGTASLIRHFLKEAFTSTFMGKIAYFVTKNVFKLVGKKMDPRLYNGAILLGLKGIAVKSHGGADGIAFSEAIKVAYDLAQERCSSIMDHAAEPSFNQLIQERLNTIKG